ncbi:MAG: DegQ family serine endoprotease [Gemmatimonadota bacterium]|nr:MAG: DegQ family serine endoprotease [Gemmatimonadota bacterium]
MMPRYVRRWIVVGALFGTLMVLAPCLVLEIWSYDEQEGQSSQNSAQHEDTKEVLRRFCAVFDEVADEASPVVVSIFAEQIVKVPTFGLPGDPFRDFFGPDFFKHFFGQQPEERERRQRSLGSGVIVSNDGYILTNNHVVEGADKLTVMLTSGKKYEARIVGTDPQTDVGVIKIEAQDLPAAKLGDSDKVRVGEWVLAIGNPFGLANTVTAGIISAKGRANVGLAAYEDFLQTDAAINPGNSGGALINMDGELVGINTAIFSRSGGYQGIGFAVPINMARRVMEELRDSGKVTRGYLALLPQDIDEKLAKAMNLKSTEGSLVGNVTPGGPADKAGIKRGDVIIEVDGSKIKDSTQLRNVVAAVKPGTQVHITLLRDGKEMKVSAELAERPTEVGAKAPERREEKAETKLGLSVQDLTPDIEEQLGYKGEKGAVVTSVIPGSQADEAGIALGDLIKEVNRKEVTSASEFSKSISLAKGGDTLLFLLRRGENTFFVAVEFPMIR